MTTEAVAAPPIRPLGDRVVVTALAETERKTAAGIVVPDVAQEKPQQGIVVAIGPEVGQRIRDLNEKYGSSIGSLEVGDRVMYGKFSGTEITIEGVPYLVLREVDVLGILDPLETPDTEL